MRAKLTRLLLLTLAPTYMLLASWSADVSASSQAGLPAVPDGAVRLLYFSSHSDITDPTFANRFAKLATAVRQARGQHDDTYLILGGSLLGPSMLGSLDQGRHMVELLNLMQPDLMAVGKREFSYGTRRMIESAAQSLFPYVSTNTVLTGEQSNLIHSFYTLSSPTLKIGFLALTSPDAMTEYGASEVTTRDVNRIVTEGATALRQNEADAVVLLADIDFPDLRYLERREVLDIVFYAHNTDNPFTLDYQGRLLDKGPRNGKLIVLDLWGQDFGIGGKQVHSSAHLLDLEAYEADQAVMKLIDEKRDGLTELLKQQIGTVKTAFDTDLQKVRSQENPFGNLVADALRETMESDIAFFNGGAIRGDRLYPAGTELTRSDIQRELPFANYTISIKLSGAQILAAIEQSLSCAARVDGCFLHMSNVWVEYDPGATDGLKVKSVRIGDKPLERSAVYTVAVSDFLARGNDRYGKFAGAERVEHPNSGRVFWDVVADFIAKQKALNLAPEGRLLDVTAE